MEQLRIDNDVLHHLLFHKALIDEEQDSSRLNQYIQMAQQTHEGEHLTINNPFDRSIALAFELVINQQLNPWDIDLVSFSTMYLQRAKQERIDLLTAGRIIYMAWKVLRLQSDELRGSMEAQREEQEYMGFDWGDLPSGAWLESDDGYSYTNLVMRMPEPPIEEPLRRQADRKVTLMELLGAFDLARKEAEEYQLLDGMRQQERERLATLARKHMKGTAHEDHLEEDILSIWQKIQASDKKTLTLVELCSDTSHEERIKTFMSVLFLAYDNKITVFQRRFPYGKIYIKTTGYT
jgi:segregation and condensation protein A